MRDEIGPTNMYVHPVPIRVGNWQGRVAKSKTVSPMHQYCTFLKTGTKKAYSTKCSQVVTHLSTNWA